MSDTTTTTPDSSFFLDGASPRLSTGAAPSPTTNPDPESAPPTGHSAGEPGLPVASPVLSSEPTPVLPTLPTPGAPTSPSDGGDESAPDAEPAPPRHPMAHLMPEKTAPSEASQRAAEIRAAKKAKAKKIKIGVVAGVLAVGALAGPPLFRWLQDAVNESGRIESDDPVEQPRD